MDYFAGSGGAFGAVVGFLAIAGLCSMGKDYGRSIQSRTVRQRSGRRLSAGSGGTACRTKVQPLDLVHLSADEGPGPQPAGGVLRNWLARGSRCLPESSDSGPAP